MNPNDNKAVQNEPKGVWEGGKSALVYYSKDLHHPFFNNGNLITKIFT